MPDVEIPKHIADRLNAVRKSHHHNKKVFEPWQDKILLECWRHQDYRQHDIADIIGYSYNTCKKRYEELARNAESVNQSKPTDGTDTGATKGVLQGRDQTTLVYRDGDTDGAS